SSYLHCALRHSGVPVRPSSKLDVMVVELLFRPVWLAFVALACVGTRHLLGESVDVKPGADRIEVAIGGKPFTVYHFARDVAKPYLMPLRTADGIVVTRGFPIGNDIGAANPKTPS